MNESDKTDELDNEDVVRHPWGLSRPWTVKGYTPQRWLSGPPRRRVGAAQAAFGSVPQGLVVPSAPQTITQTYSSLAPNNLVKKTEDNDKWRVIHVGAFVILAVSSFGSMLLSYRMYMDDKRRKDERAKANTYEPTPKINLTYQYAKEKLFKDQFPSTSIISQLGEFWIEDENFKLLDGPFRSRSTAETHRSKAIEKALKFVNK